METIFIIGIVLAIVLGILIFKLISNLIRTIITVFIILLILVAIGGFFFMRDANSLVSGLSKEQNLFLLEEQNEITAGFVMSGINITDLRPIKEQELSGLSDLYESEKYEELLSDYYKFFVFNEKALEVEKEEEDKKTIKDKILERFELPNEQTLDFAYRVINKAKSNPGFVVKEYRRDNVFIYPKTFIFKLMKFKIRKKDE